MTKDDVQEAREEVIEAMARSAEIYGLNQSYGRIYGELYFSEEPQSLDDLSEKTGYAKSTVSKVMNALEDFHMVKRRTKAESGKRIYFEAEEDFWYVLQEMLRNQGMREIRIMKRALDKAEDKLEGVDGETETEKVETLQELYDDMDTMVQMFTQVSPEEVHQMMQGMGAMGTNTHTDTEDTGSE